MGNTLRDLLPSVEYEVEAPKIETGDEASIEPVFGGLDILFPDAEVGEEDTPPLPQDMDALKTEAWSQGLRDAEKLMHEEHVQAQQELKASFDRQRFALAEELQEQLKNHVALEFEAIRNQLADQVAEILQPFVAAQSHHRIITIFAETIDEALLTCGSESPTLVAPEHLLQTLSEIQQYKRVADLGTDALAKQAFGNSSKGGVPELSLQLDTSCFETRLKDYLTKLEEAVKDV